MSSYTQTVFFTPKDALLTGNPAKLIKGAEVDPELAAIATAIASKYDSSNLFANPSASVGLANVVGSATTAMRSDAAPPLSQAIVPTWTGIHTFSATPVFSSNITVGGATFSGLANPSGTAGLTAVNGSAATAMRSDGAPAISQAITPTWTGIHTFSAGITSSAGATINAAARNVASLGQLAQSFGNTTDNPTYTFLGTGGSQFSGVMVIRGDSVGLQLQNSTPTAYGFAGSAFAFTAGSKTDLALASYGTNLNLYTAGSGRVMLGIAQAAFSFGNTTDNPAYNFLGTGTATFSGRIITSPSSGVALTANGVSTSLAGNFAGGGTVNGNMQSSDAGGTNAWTFGRDNVSTGNFVLAFNASQKFTLSSAGNVTINAPTAAGATLDVTGIAASYAAVMRGSATAGNSYGLLIQAGTSAADLAFTVNSQTGGTTFLSIGGAGSVVVGAATGGAQGLGTVNATGLFVNGVAVATGTGTTTGTFTGTFNGFAAGVTATCTWTKTGNTVTLFIPATANGTSNATTFNMTGLPAAIQPATLTQGVAASGNVVNNGVIASLPTAIFQAASGTVPFHTAGGPSNWTNTGTKGFSSVGTSFTYSVQ